MSATPMTSGTVLGRFRLIEQVDACEAAVSYTAVEGQLSAWIEWLAPEVTETAIQRLKDQRAALAGLKRLKSPELIEFGEQDRRTFIAVRRPHGETLASRIQRGGLAALETLDLLIELADALAEVHAAGFAHGRIHENGIFFVADGAHEEIQILGFGLAGLTEAEPPSPRSDLAALGRLAYVCLAGPEADTGDLPAKILERRTHLSKEVRDLVLLLLEGRAVESAAALAELAREARTVVTTDIVPVRPPVARNGAKIEVVLRTTIEAANAEEDLMEPPPFETLDEIRSPPVPDPSERRPPPAQAAGMSPIDLKTLFIAGAIIILLIVGAWIVASSRAAEPGVSIESLHSE